MIYEMPPFRPPSEAHSVLIRATRGCPWNRCAFCGMYKGQRFELRPVDEIVSDIRIARSLYGADVRRAFIGDANSLVMRVADLAAILRELRRQFPRLERITSYVRSHTLAKKSMDDLVRLRDAGLTRLHVGLESGSVQVLALMKKGATREQMIEGGRKALEAGFELSEYVVIGLGGERLWQEHAEETAAVLNEIDPHFIRVRTLAVLPGTPLDELTSSGEFEQPRVVTVLREEARLLRRLDRIRSRFVSDHVSNLVPVEGTYPRDKERLVAMVDEVAARMERTAPEARLADVRPLSAL